MNYPSRCKIGKYRITFYTPRLVRLEYAPSGTFSGSESVLRKKSKQKMEQLYFRRNGRTLLFSSPEVEIQLKPDGKPLNKKNLKLYYVFREKKRLWSTGEKPNRSLGILFHDLGAWNPRRRWLRTEGLLSLDGYWFFDDSIRVVHSGKKWAEQVFEPEAQDWYFLGYGTDFKTAFSDFFEVFGRVPLLPKWVLGFWYSRYYAFHQRDLEKLVQQYKQCGIALDVLVIDTDWRKGVWTGYDWNDKFFPNPKQFIRKMKKHNIKITLNDHPGYGKSDPIPSDDSMVPELEKKFGKRMSKNWSCDWNEEKSVSAWKELFWKRLLKEGIDFWWVDGRGELSQLKNRTREFEQFWSNQHYFAAAEESSKDRALILSRFGGVGSHRFPLGFSGDTFSNWETLKFQIPFTVWGGHLGFLWSHDIGGFLGKKLSRELFIRWVQFGALSPVFRTHSDHGIREPWLYGKEALEIFKKMARVRQKLVPYLYTQLYRMHRYGEPLVRGTFYEFPEDKNAYKFPGQYFLGKDLLIIPADGPAQPRKRYFEKSVYFPKGKWFSLEKDEAVIGPIIKKIKIPISEIPVYIREGAIVPLQLWTDVIRQNPPNPLFVDFYPGTKPCRFELYEDDGASCRYQKGEHVKTIFSCAKNENKIVLTMKQLGKQFPLYPKQRNYLFHVLLPENKRVRNVLINSKEFSFDFTHIYFAGEFKNTRNYCRVRFAHRTFVPTKIQIDFQ